MPVRQGSEAVERGGGRGGSNVAPWIWGVRPPLPPLQGGLGGET